MTIAGAVSASSRTRRNPPVPLLLFLASAVLYVGAARYSGQLSQLNAAGFVGLAQRMVGLGIVAIGQTFVILAGSIDLSVANLISVAAVLASFVMQGDPAMIAPAVVLVLAVSAAVGALNGVVVAKLGVNPLIATLGVGLILQGLLSASFNNFAGSFPEAFQGFAYGTVGILPWCRCSGCCFSRSSAPSCSVPRASAPSLRDGRQCRRCPARRNPHRPGHHPRARHLQPDGGRHRALSRLAASLGRALGRPRWRLRS